RATTPELSPVELLEDSWLDELPCVSAEGGGLRVLWLLMPSTLHVAGPTTPSTVRPWRACRRRTAASVSGPNVPSACRWSADCRRLIAPPPLEPSPPSDASSVLATVPVAPAGRWWWDA